MEEINTEIKNPHFTTFRETFRPLWGGIFGFILSIGLLLLFQNASLAYFDGANSKSWDPIMWGNGVIRLAACVVVTFASTFVAGIISRKKGGIIGVVICIPSILFWVYYFIGLFRGELPLLQGNFTLLLSTKSVVLTLSMIAANLIAGYTGGEAGMNEGDDQKQYFDSRSNSFLGIKWFHFLWIPLVLPYCLYPAIISSFTVATTSLMVMALPEYDLSSILPSIIGWVSFFSIYATYKGLLKSYELLAHPEIESRNFQYVLRLLLYCTIFPFGSFAVVMGFEYLLNLIFG